jgi:uncharacterized protein (TIRG00374 family)
MQRRTIRVAAMLALAAVLLAFLVLRAHPAVIAEQLSDANILLLAVVVGLYLVNVGVKSLRWYVLVADREHPVPLRSVALYFVIGQSINNTTPGHLVGEAVRSTMLKDKTGYPVARGMASIFLEKTIDTIVTIVLAICALALLSATLSHSVSVQLLVSTAIIAAFMVALIVFVAHPGGPRLLAEWSFRKLGRWVSGGTIESLRRTVDGFLGAFEEGTRDISRNRAKGAVATGLTLVIWINESARLWLVFLALGYNASSELMVLAATLSSFAALLVPIGAGNSLAIAGICGLAGIDAHIATSASLLFIMTSVWLSVLMGLAAMAVKGVQASGIVDRAGLSKLHG